MGIGPSRRHELGFGNHLAGTTDEQHEDVQGPPAKSNLTAVLQQEPLRGKYDEGSER
jgi:hypothetical protein